MTVCYQIYCGLDSNGFEVNTEALVYKLASKYFPDGYSVREEQGSWLSRETGETIREKTLVVTWYVTDHDKLAGQAHKQVSRFAGAYKTHGYQESVLVVSHECYGVMV